MTPRERCLEWQTKQKHTNKRLLRNTAFFAAVSLCLGIPVLIAAGNPEKAKAVMSRLTAGFEYDDTLGRLQYVSNLLPDSAMVFLSKEHSVPEFAAPADAEIIHDWTQKEPWLEYKGSSGLSACLSGEVVTLVSNRAGIHTVRIMHENGYESIYSGLNEVDVKECDWIESGQKIGVSAGNAAFELRKDGISVLPVFSGM